MLMRVAFMKFLLTYSHMNIHIHKNMLKSALFPIIAVIINVEKHETVKFICRIAKSIKDFRETSLYRTIVNLGVWTER